MNKKFLTLSVSLLSSGIVSASTNVYSKNGACCPAPQKQELCCPDECKQSEPLDCCPIVPAYNAPARIALQDECCLTKNSFFIDASFLYWTAIQEGLDIATSAGFVETPNMELVPAYTDNGQVLSLDFEYRPGFKVGVGYNVNEWVLSAEYTWIRQHASVSKNAPSTSIGPGVWLTNGWIENLSTNGSGQTLSLSHIHAKWNLGMDLLDVSGGRPFYQGKTLTISPFAGLRAAWIRQRLSLASTEQPGAVNNPPSQPVKSSNNSHSWAIGPRMGLDAHWLLSKGFRIEGDFAGSLLFTRYTSIKHKESAADTLIMPHTLKSSQKDYDCVRPVLEMGLGVGWGTYLANQKFHIDFSADYDFSYFFSQNMMRSLMDQFVLGSDGPRGDLAMHGLTLSGRFDF